MKAKAAIFNGPNTPFTIEEFEVVKAPQGYAGCKIIASGVCGTDMHFYKGRLAVGTPSIIGHEFIGVVDQISEEDSTKYDIKIGDNVIADIAVPCGECKLCKTGDDANCVNMKVTNGGNPFEAPHFWGGFAKYNFTPVSNLIKLPASVNPKAAAVFACPGPTAIHAFCLAEEAGLKWNEIDTAVVQGLGPVGSFAVAYLKSKNIKNIICIVRSRSEKRDTFAKNIGATEVLYMNETSNDEILKHVMDLTGGLGADLVFEGSGAPSAIPVGIDLLRNRGFYLVPGQYSNNGGIEIQPQLITFKALRIIGSSQYSVKDVKKYCEFLVENKDFEPHALSAGTFYDVEDVNTAFEEMAKGKNIKTLLI